MKSVAPPQFYEYIKMTISEEVKYHYDKIIVTEYMPPVYLLYIRHFNMLEEDLM